MPRITPAFNLCEMIRVKLIHSTKSAIIDNCDLDLISKFKWYCKKERNYYYAITYIKENGRHRALKMHRLILDAKTGQIIDHKDQNGLNNRRDNLRFATNKQNAQNRAPNNGYKYRGVVKGYKDKYNAIIHVNGKKIYLGSYNTDIEAAAAYNDAAIKYYGEFAYLNKFENLSFMYKFMSLT